MIVNIKFHGINRGAHKLTRILTLMKRKGERRCGQINYIQTRKKTEGNNGDFCFLFLMKLCVIAINSCNYRHRIKMLNGCYLLVFSLVFYSNQISNFIKEEKASELIIFNQIKIKLDTSEYHQQLPSHRAGWLQCKNTISLPNLVLKNRKKERLFFFLFPASTYMMTFTIKTSLLTRPALVLQMNPRNM